MLRSADGRFYEAFEIRGSSKAHSVGSSFALCLFPCDH